MIHSNTDPGQSNALKDRAIRAIVLDDDTVDRRRLRRLSKHIGLTIDVKDAHSIGDFCRALNDQSYDVAFIDHHLPEGSGLDALRILGDHPQQSNAAAIMIVGEADAGVAAGAMRGGCTDFLIKGDLSPERLRESVLRALDRLQRRYEAAVEDAMTRHRDEMMAALGELIQERLSPEALRDMIVDTVSDMSLNQALFRSGPTGGFRISQAELADDLSFVFR